MVAVFKVQRKESSIEGAFLRKVKKNLPFMKCKKLDGNGDVGWPDRMVLGPNQFCVFIEFKRPGKKPTAHQEQLMGAVSELGFPVTWADDDSQALEWLKAEFTRHLTQSPKSVRILYNKYLTE